MTKTISRKVTTDDNELTMKGIRPGTEYDALCVRLMFLEVQQVTDQHLDLRPVTSEALHFANGFEKTRVNVVVVDDTS